MKTKLNLGRDYTRLILHRAGMMGPQRAEEAKMEIDSLTKNATDEELKEAAKNLARTASMGGSDYDAEYNSSLKHLKSESERLKKSKSSNNYYKCIGCGNCVNAEETRGKCEICKSQNWLACTDSSLETK